MKFLPLIWTGIWRKPGRTVLIILQVAVAFTLFGVLQGMKTGVETAISKIRADLLMVQPNVFGEPPLPLAYQDRLKTLPGVKQVSYADGLLGTYQKPDQSRPDPNDRRGKLIALTPTGRSLIDTTLTRHVANEQRLLASLTTAEQEKLNALLKKLIASL